jgi:hypothetical protein
VVCVGCTESKNMYCAGDGHCGSNLMHSAPIAGSPSPQHPCPVSVKPAITQKRHGKSNQLGSAAASSQ